MFVYGVLNFIYEKFLQASDWVDYPLWDLQLTYKLCYWIGSNFDLNRYLKHSTFPILWWYSHDFCPKASKLSILCLQEMLLEKDSLHQRIRLKLSNLQIELTGDSWDEQIKTFRIITKLSVGPKQFTIVKSLFQ